jgi:phosphonate transport system ATP-binding protein
MGSLLEFKSVGKVYPDGTKALRSVSFSVMEGEFVSIIGPSGSGKSTVLRSINRLNTISSGSIFFDGREVSRLRGGALRQLRRSIGMIFQNYNLVLPLSVMQNTLHGTLGQIGMLRGVLGIYRESDKIKALKVLSELGMEEYALRRACELSGGQKQRVGIARALMQNPKMLLCDEPIASLDPASAKATMELLRMLSQKRGIACIVNLHQLDAARRYSDRIIGLRRGQVVFDGVPSELGDEAVARIYGEDPEGGESTSGGQGNDAFANPACA